jgi:hypothetical protein
MLVIRKNSIAGVEKVYKCDVEKLVALRKSHSPSFAQESAWLHCSEDKDER